MTILGIDSNFMFVDAHLQGHLLYPGNYCSVSYDYRLANNIEYISEIAIFCTDSDQLEWTVLDDTSIRKVQSLSPFFIEISPASSTYYPGEFFKFTYTIMDKLSNKIQYNESNGFQLQYTNYGYF